MHPTITRLTAVLAGMHFPFYAFREIMFPEKLLESGPEWARSLSNFYETPPAELTATFTNPQYPLERVVTEYRKHPQATEAESAMLNKVLHDAFYRMDDHVYRWFRLGQVSIAYYLNELSKPITARGEAISAFVNVARAAGVGDSEVESVLKMFDSVESHLRAGKIQHQMDCSSLLFGTLIKLASKHDRSHTHSGGHLMLKVASLMALMAAAFSGFYFLETTKAVMWLIFIVTAIPPILAVLFESAKLTGSNVVELYRLGLRGIPILGKLVGN
jgi:hypothetical protein